MGLAASQARFLNLTARKTNLEYEGQQINQQRTTLANESANTYNQMLTLSVPTPPSETSYQTIVYSVSIAGESYNIGQITGSENGKYKVLYTSTQSEYRMDASSSYRITKEGSTYKYGTHEIKSMSQFSELDASKTEIQTAMNGLVGSTADVYVCNLGSETSPKYVYFNKSELEAASNSDAKSDLAQGYAYGNYDKTVKGTWEKATITRDANNRISEIQAKNLGNGDSYTVTSSTVLDSVAYDDAYNEYEYQTYLYQQKMEEINAQTSVIQAQDKKLELRLKQLDTEQNAISTEIESLNSLIDKNVENSFKVFA